MPNTKNIYVNAKCPPTNIPLGRQGENLATCVTFDCTGLAQLYGDGTAELLHELKDGTVYPVDITQEDAIVSWTITVSDTATIGSGRAELRWYVGDTLAKSAKFRTSVSPALPDKNISTPPAPYQSWVDKVLKAAQEIKDGAISEEQLASAIAAYLEDHPIDAGLDETALAAYLVENGYLTDVALKDAVVQALADAKASGEFDGAPGKDGANGVDGQPGADGKDGADGITPNIQIGAVETLQAGNNATASITGTTENPLLNLGIPKGESVTDEQVRSAVDAYADEHGITTGATAEEAAQIQQNAAAVTSLKSDLADKLPKSPTNWDPWTAEEQAAALDRMGIDKPFELIETIKIDTDDVGRVTRDVTPDGAPYNFESMMVRITSFGTNMSGNIRAVYAHRTSVDKFDSMCTAIINAASFNDMYMFCEKRNGIWIAYTILSHTNGVARSCYAQPHLLNLDKKTITGVCLYFSSSNFIIGSEIKIYGVRA